MHRRHLPEFWTMGAGPKVIELTGKYADGFMTVAPGRHNARTVADYVAKIKKSLTEAGRDSDDFGFGCMFPWLFRPRRPHAIEAIMENPSSSVRGPSPVD